MHSPLLIEYATATAVHSQSLCWLGILALMEGVVIDTLCHIALQWHQIPNQPWRELSPAFPLFPLFN